MDFQFDDITRGRRIKILNVTDELTREALAGHVARHIRVQHLPPAPVAPVPHAGGVRSPVEEGERGSSLTTGGPMRGARSSFEATARSQWQAIR